MNGSVMKISILAPAAIALALSASACSPPEVNDVGSPETALTTLIATMQYGSDESVWSFLGPNTRADLELRAAGAEALGLEPQHPASFLVAVWLPFEADIATVERIETTENTTTLQIETYLGHTSEVSMLHTDEGWLVELELPSAPTVE